MNAPRFRIAPSPTGFFHVGGARTALYNWALAKRLGGTFVLRIEDTDEARNRPEWTDGIIDALAWIGISSDDPTFEGPYHQSAYAGQQQQLSVIQALGGGRQLNPVAQIAQSVDNRGLVTHAVINDGNRVRH